MFFFFLLASSAIKCPTTDQSAESLLYSSQLYMLQGQTDTAVVRPQGTKLWLSLYDSVGRPSLGKQSQTRQHTRH